MNVYHATKRAFNATNGIDNARDKAYIKSMLTFYLQSRLDYGYRIVLYNDNQEPISIDTYFSLEIARMRLTELEEAGNICIDEVGY